MVNAASMFGHKGLHGAIIFLSALLTIQFLSGNVAQAFSIFEPDQGNDQNFFGPEFDEALKFSEELQQNLQSAEEELQANLPAASEELQLNPQTSSSDEFKGDWTKDMQIYTISDLDKKSQMKRNKGTYFAYLKQGTLHFNPIARTASVTWEPNPPQIITSGFSNEGRGMELSTLNVFNGKLYSCDDKTGIVFELRAKQSPADGALVYEALPWVILAAAKGLETNNKGFKCEWATVKDGDLWVGGHGNLKDKLVRVITPDGQVKRLDWSQNFRKMAEALGAQNGYVTNEAAEWSDILQKWVFLPRKISKERFKEETDENKGSNKLVIADEDFEEIEVREIGHLDPTHGFSSVKFIPGTEDQVVVALKTIEIGDETASFVLVADLNNHLLMDETKFADDKYEGVELAKKRRRRKRFAAESSSMPGRIEQQRRSHPPNLTWRI